MLDRRLVEQVAGVLATDEGLVEKDWYVVRALAADAGRGGEATASSDPATLFASMIERLRSDRLWAIEYDNFVRQVSFARPDERIGFDQALAAVVALVDTLGAA